MEEKYKARTELENKLLFKCNVKRCDLCFQEKDMKKEYPLHMGREHNVNECVRCGQEIQVKHYSLLVL